MKKALLIIACYNFLLGCSGGGGGGSSSAVNYDAYPDGPAAAAAAISGTNVIPVEINSSGYLNEPVVSVQICNPGTGAGGTCVTVNNILLDTGSSGLRVFNSKLTALTLTQVNNAGGSPLVNCTKYADGTAHWGPVKTADVILGGETVSNVNIQVLNDQFGTSSVCGTAEPDNGTADYNGILGVGIRDQDCGATCVGSSSAGKYYSCTSATTGSSCAGSLATLGMQVRNPVGAMTTLSNSDGIADNNGTVLVLPSAASTGVLSASGYLVFGINTRGGGGNNASTGSTKVLATDSSGLFVTNFNGTNMSSFIDSGSNGLFFPQTSSTPYCEGEWYCPTSTLTLSATHKPYGGGTNYSVSFDIVSAGSVFAGNNYAVPGLSALFSGYFDWGLGFFYGRSVFTGINGGSANINGIAAPFYAY